MSALTEREFEVLWHLTNINVVSQRTATVDEVAAAMGWTPKRTLAALRKLTRHDYCTQPGAGLWLADTRVRERMAERNRRLHG